MTLCMLSCTPDNEFILSNGNMGSFGFSIGMSTFNDGFESLSQSQVIDTFVLDGDTLELVCTVSDLDTERPEKELATRGTPVYGRGGANLLKDIYGHFNASAFIVESDGSLTDFKENNTTTNPASAGSFINVDYGYEADKNTSWEYWKAAGTAANNFFWWQEYPLCFYAYAPTSSVTAYPFSLTKDNFKKDGKIEFTYTVPVSSSSPRTDAEKQPDILITSTGKTPLMRKDLVTETISGDEFSLVPLTFYHALSGVRFKADKTLADNESGLVINSITLSGLKSTGTCTFDPAASGSKSSNKISWSNYGTNNDGTYTQTFDYTVPSTLDTDDDATIYGAENGTGANKNFMLIPQTYGPATGSNATAATITIDYTFKGVPKTKSTLLASGTTNVTWLPGKLYTYAIRKVVNNIDVSVVETFSASSKTKTDVSVKNTGTANAYIRAAVVAYWVNADGTVIAPLNFTDTNQCTFSGFDTTKWIEGSDGFYYYPNILKPGSQPSVDLFESLVAKTSPADPDDAHLVVTVIAQGLSAEVTNATTIAASTWGGITASQLTTTEE